MIESLVIAPGTSASGIWMVSGTTRNFSLASIITARGAPVRCGQKFGMAGIGKAAPVQHRLVDGRGDHRRRFARQGRL